METAKFSFGARIVPSVPACCAQEEDVSFKKSHAQREQRSQGQAKCVIHLLVIALSLICVSADIVHCPGCGSPKLAHNICPECYSSLRRAWKSEKGGSGDIPTVL